MLQLETIRSWWISKREHLVECPSGSTPRKKVALSRISESEDLPIITKVSGGAGKPRMRNENT
jgi:hypothetical protein